MGDLLDPGLGLILLLVLSAVLGGAVGVFLSGVFGLVASGIALLLYGFVAGRIGAQRDREHVGFLFLSGLAAAAFAFLMPVTVIQGLAGFFIGYVVGMRMQHR